VAHSTLSSISDGKWSSESGGTTAVGSPAILGGEDGLSSAVLEFSTAAFGLVLDLFFFFFRARFFFFFFFKGCSSNEVVAEAYKS
jgi:hypothetical protein